MDRASTATLLLPAAIALLWLQLFVSVAPVWVHGEYYEYGWFVPPLAVFFAWRRWNAEAGGRRTEAGGRRTEAGGTEDGGRKPEDGGRKPEDGGRKPEDGGRKPEDGGRKPEDGGRKPEDGGRKPEDGGRKPEDGGRKPEDGGRKPEDGGRKPEDGGRKPEASQRPSFDSSLNTGNLTHDTSVHSSFIIQKLPLLLALATVLVLPLLRLIELADPGWRPPFLVHAALVVAATHLLVGAWVGHRMSLAMLPVTIFALSAVPYPWQVEQALVRNLTSTVIDSTSDVFVMAGRPVEALGDRLCYGSDVVAVTDGCSGIRSLQSLLMASLFFGEVFWFGWGARLILVGVAVVAAPAVNIARAYTLAWLHFTRGPEAAASAHDAIGHAAFLLAAVILLGVSWRMATRRKGRTRVRRVGGEFEL